MMMLNTQMIAKKLEILFDYYQLNASAFADKIGVQRSSLSHLLSGRNKPSLEFVMKIVEAFPEVDLYWLITNKGSFPKSDAPAPTVLPKEIISTKQLESVVPVNNSVETVQSTSSISTGNLIEKVMVFYKNGTVKSYQYKE
jgi:transcriptional regulator with XRE-family HTH domain